MGQISTIAGGTDPMLGFAGQHRSDLNLGHTRILDLFHGRFINLFSGLYNYFFRKRILNILQCNATQNPLAQPLNHLTAFHQRFYFYSHQRAAVMLGNHAILSHIGKSSGQIPGICRLKRRVGKSLSGPVSRYEVLQHRKPFSKISRNGCFYDLAGRLCHEPPHTRQLAHLILASPGSGVCHHINGVESFLDHGQGRFIRTRFRFGLVSGGRLFHGLHHLVGNIIGGFGPDIHHFVVFLSLCNEPFRVLSTDFRDLIFRLFKNLPL